MGDLVQGEHTHNLGGVAEKTCNISETEQDKTKVTLDDQQELHRRFRLLLKSSTLDDRKQPLRTLFQNTCVLEPIMKL